MWCDSTCGEQVVSCGKLASGKQSCESRVRVLGMANAWERKKQTGKSSVPQTGEFPKQFGFPFEKKMSLGWGGSCCARKEDEAGLLRNPYFTSGKPSLTVPFCCLRFPPGIPADPARSLRGPLTFPPSWHPALPSQPGLLLQVLRQIAQIVAMRSVASQEIPADRALSIPCYQHKLNTSYRHRCSHPVYTALPHSAQCSVVVAIVAKRYMLVWLPKCSFLPTAVLILAFRYRS